MAHAEEDDNSKSIKKRYTDGHIVAAPVKPPKGPKTPKALTAPEPQLGNMLIVPALSGKSTGPGCLSVVFGTPPGLKTPPLDSFMIHLVYIAPF